jgi:small subunit ribosomal protein S5
MALINPDTLDLKEQVVRTNKVQKTHKGGRTMSWSVLIVVGDGNGHVGAGIGKARAIPDAIRKGVEAAKKNLVKVPMVGTTIPHEILSRTSAAKVLLRPAAPGTGVVAGGSVRAILEAAGVRDVLAKSLGSSNPINGAWATLDALRHLKRASEVARLRGKDILDIVSKKVAASSGEDIGFVPSMQHAAPVVEEAPVAAPIVAEAPESTEAPISEVPAVDTVAPEAPVAEATTEPAAE